MPVSTVTSRLWPRRVVELDSEARVGKDPQQCQWLSSAGCKSLHAAITTLGNGFCLEIAKRGFKPHVTAGLARPLSN
jgi:hypothetical protein